jgi:hypothetical protein
LHALTTAVACADHFARYTTLGFTALKDTAAAQAVPYVVVDAADVIRLCSSALTSFSGAAVAITCICRCLFSCTHSQRNARYAAMCGALVQLKLIVRDGSLGSGAVAAAAAALCHVISNSGMDVENEPLWQDASLLEKLLFVVAGVLCLVQR